MDVRKLAVMIIASLAMHVVSVSQAIAAGVCDKVDLKAPCVIARDLAPADIRSIGATQNFEALTPAVTEKKIGDGAVTYSKLSANTQNRITSLETGVNGANGRIGDLEGQTTTLSRGVTDLQGQATQFETRIGVLENPPMPSGGPYAGTGRVTFVNCSEATGLGTQTQTGTEGFSLDLNVGISGGGSLTGSGDLLRKDFPQSTFAVEGWRVHFTVNGIVEKTSRLNGTTNFSLCSGGTTAACNTGTAGATTGTGFFGGQFSGNILNLQASLTVTNAGQCQIHFSALAKHS